MATSTAVMIDAEAEDRPRATQTAPVPGDLGRVAERVFLFFLAAVSLYMLYFSAAKMLWFDEMLSFYTEHVASTAAVLRIQATTPVSLDPPLYHLLGHWALVTGINQALAVRLPSLLGTWLMLATVYLFARRLAGSTIAAVTVTGIIIADNFHMVEARPYGILLGATGLALLSWQQAILHKRRPLSLFGIFLALAIATSCHYFGILVAAPFLLVEALRWRLRGRLDLPLVAVMLLSYLPILSWLPYLKAAHQYKANYYTRVQLADLFRAYTAVFDGAFKIHAPATDALIALAVVAVVVAGAWIGYRIGYNRSRLGRGGRQGKDVETRAQWTLVVLLTLLPVLGVALAAAASGAFETRYVLGFSPGIAIGISAALVYLLRSRLLQSLLLLACCALTVAMFVRSARENDRQAAALIVCAQRASTGSLTVITNDDDFVRLHTYYEQAYPAVKNAVWVADMEREIRFTGTDNRDRTMLYLTHFTSLPVISYQQLRQHPDPFLLIESQATQPANWLATQLRLDHAQIQTVATHRENLFESVRN